MTRFLILLVSAALVAGCTGYDGKQHASRAERDSAKAGRKTASYQEVEHNGRIYVVGSQKSADAVKKGEHLPNSITKIGAGPNRETVVIEANKAYVEDDLIAEWNKRHGGNIKK